MESEGLRLSHHFIHSHPLTLKNLNRNDETNCAICNRRCSGPTYACCSGKCKSFVLHQSCFDLPQKIRHQIHGGHPLVLDTFDEKKCLVCSVTCVGFVYHCYNCQIYLDVVCLSNISMIKYQGHEHNLFFSPNWNSSMPDSCCHACGTEPHMSSPIHSLLFCCVECDFFLHLKCGPLPCAIEHEDHKLHPLTLTDSPVVAENEDRDGTETNQFVCDACEKVDRDPRLPVYYCHEGCHYLAEFECVIPEVIRSLMGYHGEVELKTPVRHVPGLVIASSIFEATDDTVASEDEIIPKLNFGDMFHSWLDGMYFASSIFEATGGTEESEDKIIPRLTFNDILHSLIDGDMEELRSIIEASKNDIHQYSSELFSLIIKAAKTQFQDLLNCVYNHEYPESWAREKIVSVGDHLIPMSLAPILEDLCAKYEDIGVESTLRSSKLKTYCIVMLCVTVNNMYATRVVDISEDRLANWLVNLKILQFAGFKVQFTFDHFKRVMHAYNGIQIEDEAKQKHEALHREIEEVSQTIEQLKAELATKTKMLEELKKRSKNIESEPEFSAFKGDCLREASALRWKVAGEGLL